MIVIFVTCCNLKLKCFCKIKRNQLNLLTILAKSLRMPSVGFEMLSGIHRLALSFYNFASITALKYENQRYEVSTMSLIVNCLKFPFFPVLTAFILRNREFLKPYVLPTLISFEKFVPFTMFAMDFATLIPVFFIIFLFVSMLLKCKKLRNLLNYGSRIVNNEKCLMKFRRLCVHQSVTLLAIFSTSSIVQYLGTTKITFLTMIVAFFFLYPSLTVYEFVSFVKTLESFVVVSLQEMKSDLKSL